MSQREFEDHIRREMLGHSLPVDGEALWSQIQPQLRKRKRRGFFWLWLLGAALATSVLFFWWYGASDTSRQATAPIAAEDQMETKEVAIPAPSQNEAQKKSEKLSTKNAAAKKNPPLPSKNSATSKQVITPNAKQSAGKNLFERNGTAKEEPFAKEADAPKFVPASEITSATNDGTNAPDSKSLASANRASEEATVSRPDQYSSKEEKTTPGSIDNAPFENQVRAFIHLPRLASITLGISANPYPLPADLNPTAVVTEDRETRRRKKEITLAIELQAGIGSATKSLTAKTAEAAPYRDRRQASERSLEVLSTGANIWLHHRSGLYARTGLHLSQITEQFDYAQTTFTTDTLMGTREIFIDANGDSTFVDGLISLQRETRYEKRTYNTLRLFDVPLIVGYEIQQDRFSFGVEGGAMFNFQLHSEGDILAEDEADGYLSLADDDIMKTSVGLSYFAALRINYQVGESWQISASPYFRYFPQNFTTDAYPLEQRYQFIGGQIGVKYYFK